MLSTLIEELRSQNVRISASEGRLICSAPPGVLTPELKTRIQDAKAGLLNMLDGVGQVTTRPDPIEHLQNQTSYPLSSPQRRFAMTGHADSVLPAAFHLLGALNIVHLNETLNHFVSRHAPLRSRFDLNARPPDQSVIDYQYFELQITPLSDVTGNTVEATLERLQGTTVDLQIGNCYHFELLTLSPEEHILFAAFSPMVFDGWSFDLFWRELTGGYAALIADNDWPYPLLEYSYADCSSWLASRIKNRMPDLENFWRKQLGDILPLDVFPLAGRPTDDRQTSSLPFRLDHDLTGKLRGFTTQSGLTTQSIILAAIYIWSYRLRGIVDPKPDDTSALDVVIGIAVENRPHVDLEGVAGPFANLILIRESLSTDPSFIGFAKQVQNDLLKAHEYQEFPVDFLQIRSRPGSTRTFQIEFSFQQATGRSECMGPLRIEQIELRSETSAVDLAFWVKDWGKQISGAIEFLAGSFDKAAVEQWIRCYYSLLDNLLTSPDIPVSRHLMLNQQEVDQIVNTAKDGPSIVVDERGELQPFDVPGHVPDQDGLYTLNAKTEVKTYAPHGDGLKVNAESLFPQTDTELRLEILVQEILGQRIGIQSNLFDSGLNSLLALSFIKRCQEELRLHISIPVIFKYPSIVLLARYLDEIHQHADVRMLVELQPRGNYTPLYCICGINLYRRLAIALGEKQPTYAIYVPNEQDLLSEKGTETTTELAQIYWNVIRKHHDGGPLRLLGFCFGGALAYETALLARTAGLEVEQLILVDTALSKNMTRRLHSRIAQWLPHGVRLRIKQFQGKIPTEKKMNPATKEVYDSVLRVITPRLDDYAPKEQYDGETIMINSSDIEMNAAWKSTPLVGWEGILLGPVHPIHLSTRHTLLLTEPNVEIIAEKLRTIFSGSDH